MAIRTIDFPDPTDPSFDANEPFEAPNGIIYTWNGYGWEVNCGFGDPACIMDGETEFLAYVAGTDLAEGQVFIDADSFYFKGDQTAFVEVDDEFQVGDDTFTVTAVETVTDATYGVFTKVTVAEDLSGLIGLTLEIQGLCAPIGKRYLLAHGDTIKDADGDVTYTWNDGVIIKSEDRGYTGVTLESSRSKVIVRTEDGEGDVKVEADDTFFAKAGSNYFESNYRTTVTSLSSDVSITAANNVAATATNNVVLQARFGDVEINALESGSSETLQREINVGGNPKQITNKEYVDNQDELLRQDIIELEEEINAIAPSLEYGTWKYEEPTGGNVTRPPASGTFYLMNGTALTNEYLQTTVIKIHNDEYVAPGDTDPVDNHTWADADVGELIQLFDAADPDFFLGKITAKNVDPVGEFVTITVDRVQSSGTPDDNADPVTGEYLTRVNIFKEPSGGTASDFVLKSGDTMEGPSPLVFKTAKTSYNSSSPGSNTAYIQFQNKYGSGTGVHDVNIFMGGGSSSLAGLCITGRPLHVSNTIYSSGQYKARNSSSEYNPSIYLASEEGQIRYNGSTKFTWKSDGIREMIIKNNDGDKGMVIKRDRSTTNRVEWSGVVDIDTSGTNRCIGELWYNKNDGVMYLRIS